MQVPKPGQKAPVAVSEATSQQAEAYEMRVRGIWYPCIQGNELTNGWLEFRTPDGKKGLAPFGTWRKLAPRP
jgi:hypothetical protein